MRTYVVWCPDLGQEQEDGATIPATDPADAAEGWAADVRGGWVIESATPLLAAMRALVARKLGATVRM